MYTITLETNTICNLRCRYCYLGKKTNKNMRLETGKRAIDIAINETCKQYDKKLFVCFLGGEPLLSSDFIEDIVKYSIAKCNEKTLDVCFGITTNGTIINDKIISILSMHPFSIRISIDGDEMSHNRNRIKEDGEGSYDLIVSNLGKFIKISEENKEILRAVQVISCNTIKSISKNLTTLFDLGFKYIETGYNGYQKWGESDIISLKEEMLICVKKYEEIVKCDNSLYWSVYFTALNRFLYENKRFYYCMAGMSSIFVNVDGKIYFCKETNAELSVGDVFEGLDAKRIRDIAYIRNTKNKNCLDCRWLKHCSAKGCFTENYSINGDIYNPVIIECEMTKFFNQYFDNKYNEIEREILRERFDRIRGCQ